MDRSSRPRFLLLLAVAAVFLGLGVFLRLSHLATKVYWHDEVYTSLWLSGFDPTRHWVDWGDGREVRVGDLLDDQRIHPARGLTRTIRTLARNDSQHPPLYYAFAWLSARYIDDSIATLRGLSAFFGLLLLPAMYWLCAEVYGHGRGAWLGMLLMAVSPVQLLYAQEAREYSLWSLFIVISTAALLYARRIDTWKGWSVYGLSVASGLYTHGLFPLAMVAHAGWVLAIVLWREWRGDHGSRRFLGKFLVASAAACLIFAPWAWIIYQRLSRVQSCVDWLRETSPWGTHLELWWNNLATNFVDDDFDGNVIWGWKPHLWLQKVTLALGLGGLLCSWRHRPRHIWLLALLLLLAPLAVLGGPDLFLGGQRSTQGRFLFPCYVGLTLATVHLLAPSLQAPNWTRRVGACAVAFSLLTIGAVSSLNIWQANCWWNKGGSWHNQLQAIRTINESPHPLILSGPITRDCIGHTLAVSHLLDPRIPFRVIADSEQLSIPNGFSDVYFLNVSEHFVRRNNPELRLERMATDSGFWRCVK